MSLGCRILRPGFPACTAFFLLLIFIGMAAPAMAQTALVPPPDAASSEPAQTGAWQSLMQTIHEVQRDLHRRLAQAVRAVKGDGTAAAAMFLVLLSFLYGVFHAAGPGHGKAVISAYLLANESAVKRGIALAFLASFLQAISAIALVAILAALLDMAGLRVTAAVGTLETASYALVALVGLWLLWSLLQNARRASANRAGREDRHDGAHAHGVCAHGHAPDPALLSRQGLISKAWGIVAAVGLRPCSGAVLVLLFALAHGIFLAGVAATLAMSLGTAITVSALAVLTLFSKRIAFAAMGARSQWVDITYQVLAFGGAGLLVLLGSALFLASLSESGPF